MTAAEVLDVLVPLLQVLALVSAYALLHLFLRLLTERPRPLPVPVCRDDDLMDADPFPDSHSDAGEVELGWLLGGLAVATAALCVMASRALGDVGISAGLAAGSLVSGKLTIFWVRGRRSRPATMASGRRWAR